MNDTLIAQIQRFTLDARHNLEREASEQLEGIYGWMPDGAFAPAERYPALKQVDEALDTRQRLEAYVTEENEVGFDARTARQKLVRETAFTWLNRFVALKLMEERRLLKATISRLHDSNGYLFWLADEKDPESYVLHNQGEMPVNPMGEGPRHVAYRRFLLWQCGELARDVSVLFDSETLASRLCPRPNVLKTLIAVMNAENLEDVWKPGNEETIGWLYEAFNAEEKDKVFEGFGKGKKVAPDQISPATQIFTPRWVVRFLVENSLGRLWVEMHSDSVLKETLAYLVPPPEEARRPLKPVSEITFLDTACGSMHFGLVAFDLFAEMYREELENAGKPGWPEKPSVSSADEIPFAIIANNLHGIDLDLRAVQLSALTLFLRARTMNPKCAFTDRNLACANVELITGGRLEAFIRQTDFNHPIYERILRSLAVRLKDSDNLGSLLRLETDLERLMAEEKRRAGDELQIFPGLRSNQFETEEGIEGFFGILQEQILSHLDNFVRQSRETGLDPSHFAAEAAKGLRFLRLVQQRYDVVATNPPYMSRRNQSGLIAKFLDQYYPDSKTDFYAAFIERCVELTAVKGLTAMITQQSFMFISSYEKLRISLRETVAVEIMVHLGPKAFDMVTGEKVNTTAFVLRKEPDSKQREESVGVYFRLVRERDAEAKRSAFESALAALRIELSHPLLFRYRQRDFDAIPGKPWVYWMPMRLLEIFTTLPPLHLFGDVKEGINTGDNTRFVRCWWEIGLTRIGKTQKWCLFAKGDRSYRYTNPTQYVVKNSLREIGTLSGSALRNIDFSFKQAITFLSNSPKRFCAWWTDIDHYFCSTGGRSVYPKEALSMAILGLLNSKIVNSLLCAVNPTISFKVGDVAAIPFPTNLDQSDISSLTSEVVSKTSQLLCGSEKEYLFHAPFLEFLSILEREERIAILESFIDHEVSRLYGLTDEDLATIESELSGTSAAVDEYEPAENAGEDEEETPAGAITPEAWAQSWISYAVGIVLGRFEIGVPDGLGCADFSPDVVAALRNLAVPDGILANDPGQPLDLAARVWQAMEIMLGAEETRKRVNTAFGEGEPMELLRSWFDRFAGQPGDSFWKYHLQLYRKRPVYWPLQSPKRQYTVWVFHERFTRDTLFHVRNDIVEPRLRLAEREIADLRIRAEKDRRARKELDRILDFADDMREFSQRLKAITDRSYTPHIDDGVLLNAAPLHEILPSWPDTKKAWQELETGEYDWAYQAMEYWPERVKEKCKTNRSFAIAHGLEDICEVLAVGGSQRVRGIHASEK